ncbi:hypothetical protein WME75_39735 [Sorangium sp. So ce1014]|uniref:hypothetical protein n=1 Tax=Sorangium sp. So ce1014 TaxID=3133326 RepID=UPI003F6282EC
MAFRLAQSPLKLSLEERIDQAETNKMRFFVRSPLEPNDLQIVHAYFPPDQCPPALPDSPALSPWPWGLSSDPFVEVSTAVHAMRASYLAPCVHLNMYVDWMIFDAECENGMHSPFEYDEGEERPSNVARRTYMEVCVHAILISLKSALDRLVSVVAHYMPGIGPYMTWGRIENGKSSGFMSIVEQGRERDELLAHLFKEYELWISTVVAPRDEIIHYADLQTIWTFRSSVTESGEIEPHITPVHASSREDDAPAFDPNGLSASVRAYYALADHTLLTLAKRLPRSIKALVEPPPPGIGDAIMKAFEIAPSRRVGELRKALSDAIRGGEVEPNQPHEAYIAFLRQNAARFGLAEKP